MAKAARPLFIGAAAVQMARKWAAVANETRWKAAKPKQWDASVLNLRCMGSTRRGTGAKVAFARPSSKIRNGHDAATLLPEESSAVPRGSQTSASARGRTRVFGVRQRLFPAAGNMHVGSARQCSQASQGVASPRKVECPSPAGRQVSLSKFTFLPA